MLVYPLSGKPNLSSIIYSIELNALTGKKIKMINLVAPIKAGFEKI
jgi:hypothetical protein